MKLILSSVIFFFVLISSRPVVHSGTVIIYATSSDTHALVLSASIDCSLFVPAEGITVIDCFNFSITPQNPNPPLATMAGRLIKASDKGLLIDDGSGTGNFDTLVKFSVVPGLPTDWSIYLQYVPSATDPHVLGLIHDVHVNPPFSNGSTTPTYTYMFVYSLASGTPKKEMSKHPEESTDEVYKIFPNPSEGTIRVDILNLSVHTFSVSIVDMSGKTIWTSSAKNGQNIINPANLSPGIYVVTISSNNKVFHQERLVIK